MTEALFYISIGLAGFAVFAALAELIDWLYELNDDYFNGINDD